MPSCFIYCGAFFYKHSTNNAQKSSKYGQKRYGSKLHGPLWAEMAMGRIDQRLLFAAKNFDSQ